jgi:hypothetical protein
VDGVVADAHSAGLTHTFSTSWDESGNHTIVVTASNTAGSASDQHLIVVAPEAGLLQFVETSFSVNEVNASAVVTIERIGGGGQTVEVSYASGGGTATAGADYQPVSGTLTFSPGVLSRNISVGLINDSVDEPDESVQLALDQPTAGAILGPQWEAVITVLDDDPPPGCQPGIFSFVNNTGNVGEGAATAALVVQRHNGTCGQAGVSYITADGSATAGQDYTLASGNLIFAQDVQSQTFQIPILDDDLVEGNETLTLTLNAPTDGAELGSPHTVVLTLLDNDGENRSQTHLPAIKKPIIKK